MANEQDNDRKGKDAYKWVTFALSIACFIAGIWRGYTYLHYDVGDPALRTSATNALSGLSTFLLVTTFLLSILMAIVTLPRWQAFFALALVVLTVLMLMGA